MGITVVLTRQEQEQVMLPITGERESWGGFQHLLTRLQEGLTGPKEGRWTLQMSKSDADKVVAYSDPKYGSGGYQTRLRTIAPKVRRALTEWVDPQSGLDFGE